jgi:uracil-DNA glycosylase
VTYQTRIPPDWRAQLDGTPAIAGLDEIEAYVLAQRAEHPGEIYPPDADVFTALERTRFDDVRVVILGMDPYHSPGQAHGLAFSLRSGAKPYPSSLANILREVERDCICVVDRSGDLSAWADRGVLLLNAALTVRRASPGAHLNQWSGFTDALIEAIDRKSTPVVFMLWGSSARERCNFIHAPHKTLIRSHPSGQSSWRNFSGTAPFAEANLLLAAAGQQPIDWSL